MTQPVGIRRETSSACVGPERATIGGIGVFRENLGHAGVRLTFDALGGGDEDGARRKQRCKLLRGFAQGIGRHGDEDKLCTVRQREVGGDGQRVRQGDAGERGIGMGGADGGGFFRSARPKGNGMVVVHKEHGKRRAPCAASGDKDIHRDSFVPPDGGG